MEDRGVFESRIEKRGNSRKDGKKPKQTLVNNVVFPNQRI